MEYAIGSILALTIAAFASVIGFDRDRAFYPTVVMVIASYYILFAAMGASSQTLAVEIVVASAFSVLAVIGFKRSLVGRGRNHRPRAFRLRPPLVHPKSRRAFMVARLVPGV